LFLAPVDHHLRIFSRNTSRRKTVGSFTASAGLISRTVRNPCSCHPTTSIS